MPDMTRVTRCAVDEPTINNDSPTNSRRYHHCHIVRAATGCAKMTFGQGERLGIILNRHRTLKLFRERLSQWKVTPRGNVQW